MNDYLICLTADGMLVVEFVQMELLLIHDDKYVYSNVQIHSHKFNMPLIKELQKANKSSLTNIERTVH